MLGNIFMFYRRLQILCFCKIFFMNTIRMSNSLDPDQARQNVGPDLSPNCLQMTSADDTSKQRVNVRQNPYN